MDVLLCVLIQAEAKAGKFLVNPLFIERTNTLSYCVCFINMGLIMVQMLFEEDWF